MEFSSPRPFLYKGETVEASESLPLGQIARYPNRSSAVEKC